LRERGEAELAESKAFENQCLHGNPGPLSKGNPSVPIHRGLSDTHATDEAATHVSSESILTTARHTEFEEKHKANAEPDKLIEPTAQVKEPEAKSRKPWDKLRRK